MDTLEAPSLSDGMNIYFKSLDGYQLHDLQKNTDEWIAEMLNNQEPMQNPTNVGRELCSSMPYQMPCPPGPHRRALTVFNQGSIDIGVTSMLDINPQTSPSTCGEIFYEGSSMCDGLHYESPSTFGELQYESPSTCAGLQYGGRFTSSSHYEENLLPDYDFGFTEVIYDTNNNQAASVLDFDFFSPLSPEIKKSTKKSQKSNCKLGSSCPPPPSSNANEWLVIDENGKKRRPLLHEFLRQLVDNENYSDIAAYVDRRRGIFKIYKRDVAATLWKFVKGRNSDSGKFIFIDHSLKTILIFYRNDVRQIGQRNSLLLQLWSH
jgi:hypothetical protein